MGLDLAQFHESFFEESFEALDAMEAALLKLEVGVADHDRINTIFRGAHSMKGGAGMLGFDDVASFTHTLETLLDELRSDRKQVTAAILDALLKSVDVVREMLRATQRKETVDAQRVADVQFDLEALVAQKQSAAVPAAAPSALSGTPVPAAASTAASTPALAGPGQPPSDSPFKGWSISFKPLPHLLLQGNDPLSIFAALKELGSVEARPDLSEVPPFDQLDAQQCYVTWSLRLLSDCDRSHVEEMFDWVTGDCDLSIQSGEAPDAAPVASQTSLVSQAVAPPAAQAQPAVVPEASTEATSSVAAIHGASDPGKSAGASRRNDSAKAASNSESSSIRVGIDKVDELINTVGELVITQAMLGELGREYQGDGADLLRSGLSQLERNMRQLQESVMRVRMLPISVAFSRFPRMVHDLAQRLGKKIELKMSGEQTELDKTVLEKIGDPLVHLVRNSLDHGIEQPDVRTAAGKPATGTITLNAYHTGGHIAVEISDDGAGLDKDRILAKARQRSLIGANDILTDDQVHELIFLPGFSTAEKTTDVSGRGVGMDVVRQRVKELGGTVDIRSQRGEGSRFLITLPLTLSIVDGQTVSVGGECYIVPMTSIIESVQIRQDSVSRLTGTGEVFHFRGDYLPILRLHALFGVEPRSCHLEDGLVIVTEGDGHRVGLYVDELQGQQQVVIKSLESNYGHVEGISGATILGDGSVALILDVPGLIRASALQEAA